MPATVIGYESFRIEQDRRRRSAAEAVDTAARVSFLREPGVRLTPRQIAHRQTMLDYWNRRRRAMFGVFGVTALREAATERE